MTRPTREGLNEQIQRLVSEVREQSDEIRTLTAELAKSRKEVADVVHDMTNAFKERDVLEAALRARDALLKRLVAWTRGAAAKLIAGWPRTAVALKTIRRLNSLVAEAKELTE